MTIYNIWKVKKQWSKYFLCECIIIDSNNKITSIKFNLNNSKFIKTYRLIFLILRLFKNLILLDSYTTYNTNKYLNEYLDLKKLTSKTYEKILIQLDLEK